MDAMDVKAKFKYNWCQMLILSKLLAISLDQKKKVDNPTVERCGKKEATRP